VASSTCRLSPFTQLTYLSSVNPTTVVKNLWLNKASKKGYTLIQILVEWVTISDWPIMLVGISLCSPHGSSWNILEYSFGRILGNMTHPETFKTSLGEQEMTSRCLFANNSVSLTSVPMCISLLGKSPIFPHYYHFYWLKKRPDDEMAQHHQTSMVT